MLGVPPTNSTIKIRSACKGNSKIKKMVEYSRMILICAIDKISDKNCGSILHVPISVICIQMVRTLMETDPIKRVFLIEANGKF